MNSVEQLGNHASALLTAHGISGPVDNYVAAGSEGTYVSWTEERGIEAHVHDSGYILVIDFDPTDFSEEHANGYTYNTATHKIEDLADKNLQPLAAYMLRFFSVN